MADMTIFEFCTRHNACQEGREWALASCQSMREVWDTAKPEWLMWVATRRGVLAERDLRLFYVRCARSAEHSAACAAAWDAAWAAAWGAARDAAWYAAWAAEWAAEWDAEWYAARYAARDAEWAEEWYAAREQQAAWLRELPPCFDREAVPAAAASREEKR